MTPDTAALRALADAATPGPWRWCNTQRRNGSIYLQGARTRIVMAFKRMGMTGAQPMFRGADGLLYETATANINDFPDAAYIAALDPDTVRALCDAADEVEQWRGIMARPHPADPCWQTHRLDRQDECAACSRDAARSAHAALVADLRALCDEHWDWKAGRTLHVALRRMLDRYAPEEGS